MPDVGEELTDMIEVVRAAASAKRAAKLALLAVFVAALVLVIDQTIKRSIIAEGQRIKAMIQDFQEGREAGRERAPEAGQGASPAGAALNGDGDVVHDAPAGAVLGAAGGAAEAAPAKRPARAKRGPAGNGGGTEGD